MELRRAWAMPNRETFKIPAINALARAAMESVGGLWIDPFAGGSRLAHVTNDLNPEFDTDSHLPAHEFLATFPDESVSGVLLDPPYSPRQIKECYDGVGLALHPSDTQGTFYKRVKDAAARVVRPGGKIVTCGWNSGGVGKNREFELQVVLLVAHGGNHNDTIVTVERKLTFRCQADPERLHASPNCACQE